MSEKAHSFSKRYSDEAFLKRRAKNVAKWIERAKEIHGNSFDYSLAEKQFTSQRHGLVTIKCCEAEHPPFEITPDQHLRYKQGGGCKLCKLKRRSITRRDITKDTFFAWFNQHKSAELTLKTEFNGMTGNIIVECNRHHTKKTTKPTLLMHSNQYGCDTCANDATAAASRLTNEDIELHLPDHITFEKLYFDESIKASRMILRCEEHGAFIVDKAHLKRSNYYCIECAKLHRGYAGYRLQKLVDGTMKDTGAYFGVMKINVFNIESLKVGISKRKLTQRYLWNLKEIFFEAFIPEKQAIALEIDIAKTFSKHKDDRIRKAGMRSGERWAGDTECYWLKQRDAIIEYARGMINFYRKQEPNYKTYITDWINSDPRDVARVKSTVNRPKEIACVDLQSEEVIATYPSIAEAMRVTKITGIANAVSGRRRLAGGFRWFTTEEIEQGKHKTHVPQIKRITSAVICIETGELFNSVGEAEKAKNTCHISSVCSGRRKSAGGFTWRYADPQQIRRRPSEPN
jgi:hypothetical protein